MATVNNASLPGLTSTSNSLSELRMLSMSSLLRKATNDSKIFNLGYKKATTNKTKHELKHIIRNKLV